jgi:hypothetical protein
MKRRITLTFSAIACALLLTTCVYAASPKLQVLHSFSGGADGSSPVANLVSDAAGNLYGTTLYGGSKTNCRGDAPLGCGVVFELSPPKAPGGTWTETVLYRFSGEADGAVPAAGLVLDQAGNLYGTASEGGNVNDSLCVAGSLTLGCGVVFELSPQPGGTWTETPIYTFQGGADGAMPLGNLIFDSLGNLYGTAYFGGGTLGCGSGDLIGCGTVFELSPNGSPTWTETTLYAFQNRSDGGVPTAGLTFDKSGNLYGTTGLGGPFELMPAGQGQEWTISILYPVSAHSGLIFDSLGNLYGAASDGAGSVFELSPSGGGSWTESTLYSFGSGRASDPLAGLVFDSSGNLYGTLSGQYCGAVYRLENQGGLWNEAELDFFKNGKGPCQPEASLIFGKWGAAYGTSFAGGTCKGRYACGTVFGILP